MARYEYMHLKLTGIPEKIIIEYNLQKIVTEDGLCTVKSGKECMGYPKQG